MFLFFTPHFRKSLWFVEPDTFYSHHWSIIPGRNNKINRYVKNCVFNKTVIADNLQYRT